ncbi:MAG: hypothetical protein HQL93_04670 [Magnetococcales bacterium]|nr:hypothetical protein [Magnetococcales bacterium]
MPTPEEDAAITAAAMLDLDNPPLSDLELTQFRRMVGRPKTPTHKISVVPYVNLIGLDGNEIHS